MSPARTAALRRALLRWYDARRRALPWRERVTPYRTWVSEIMLQQTTVAAVVPYYLRFLERFPDVRALAAAPEDDVLKAWAGLGYYSRARNLRRAAQAIVAEHGGKFPSDYDSVLALPGIGRYTAGAILSIAFGQRQPLVDGNVMRVFSRLFKVEEDVKKAKAAAAFWELAARLLPRRRCGDWNQALMELGATVCVPEAPSCGLCPLAKTCAANRLGLQDRLPVMPPRRAWVDLRWSCLWIEDAGRVLLWKRDDKERFLRGHWGLPESRHVKARPGRLLKTARHTITHHRIVIDVREAALAAQAPPQAEWVSRAQLGERLVSSLWTKCLP